MSSVIATSPKGHSALTSAAFFRAISWLALATALGLSFYVLWKGWNQPLIDMHGFRQTQTALTVYWLLQGGDWLAYETPVLGSPWSVPMEFPVYQWLVALAASLSSASSDHVGRAVSYFFFLLCLLPMLAIFRQLRISNQAFVATAALMLTAPTYLFWSRTFMIESTALFFALSFVALYLRWLNSGQVGAAVGAGVFGVIGILTKVTTLVPYGVLAAVLSVPPALALVRSGRWPTLAIRGAVAVVIAGVALLSLTWWVHYSDQLKTLNTLGEHLTSERLSTWNFGTYEQRTSAKLWVSTVQGRAIPEAIGAVAILWVALGIALMSARRASFLAASFVLAWLAAFLIFTNLHVIHNYYQYSNAALLIAALGFIIAEMGQSRPIVASALLAMTMAVQWSAYRVSYRPVINGDFSSAQTMQIASFIKRETPRESAILVLGYDWSAEVAYYSERKALTLPGWAPQSKVEAILASPASFVAPLPLSAVVQCRGSTPELQRRSADVALSQLAVSRTESIAGCDVSLIELQE